jgi:ATP-dependent Clp protease ATP-binding subunit ClpC
MFEHFTERARQVVVLAAEEARILKHNYIGTEHILLGLLREEEGLAARVLESLDITVERVRAQVVRIVGSGEFTSGQIPFTPFAKKALELAFAEASEGDGGQFWIDTEHLLIGLVGVDEGLAARVLLDLDADAEKIRNEVIHMPRAPRGSDRPRTRAAEVTTAASSIDPVTAEPTANPETLSDSQLAAVIDQLSREAQLLDGKIDILRAELAARRRQDDRPDAYRDPGGDDAARRGKRQLEWQILRTGSRRSAGGG